MQFQSPGFFIPVAHAWRAYDVVPGRAPEQLSSCKKKPTSEAFPFTAAELSGL